MIANVQFFYSLKISLIIIMCLLLRTTEQALSHFETSSLIENRCSHVRARLPRISVTDGRRRTHARWATKCWRAWSLKNWKIKRAADALVGSGTVRFSLTTRSKTRALLEITGLPTIVFHISHILLYSLTFFPLLILSLFNPSRSFSRTCLTSFTSRTDFICF